MHKKWVEKTLTLSKWLFSPSQMTNVSKIYQIQQELTQWLCKKQKVSVIWHLHVYSMTI